MPSHVLQHTALVMDTPNVYCHSASVEEFLEFRKITKKQLSMLFSVLFWKPKQNWTLGNIIISWRILKLFDL